MESGAEGSAVLPRPGGLNLYHALSLKHEAVLPPEKITRPPKSSRVKQILYDSFGSGDGGAREQRIAYLT